MRFHIITLLATIGCLAQDVPKISFNSTYHEFGKIRGDQKVSHNFLVTNKGRAPLNITRLNPSCGCTSTVIGKWTLNYNETSNIKVTLDPAGLCNTLRKSIQVVSNDPIYPTTTLTFGAEVLREVMPSTSSIFFDNLTRITTKRAYVKLVSGYNRPIHVTNIESHGISYLSFNTHKEGNNISLEISINGHKIPSEKRRGVDIIRVYTAHAKSTPTSIAIQWELASAVAVNTPSTAQNLS